MHHFIITCHLLFGTFLLGAFVVLNGIIHHHIQSKQLSRLKTTLKFSFFCDAIFLPIIVGEFITGTLLVKNGHYPFTTSWIVVAYTLFCAVTVNMIFCSTIKWYNYIQLKSQTLIDFRFHKLLMCLTVATAVFLMLIIRDATLKSTIF